MKLRQARKILRAFYDENERSFRFDEIPQYRHT